MTVTIIIHKPTRTILVINPPLDDRGNVIMPETPDCLARTITNAQAAKLNLRSPSPPPAVAVDITPGQFTVADDGTITNNGP